MEGRSLDDNQHLDVEPPMGERHEDKHAKGGSQPEELHGLAAEGLTIDSRRKNNTVRGGGWLINSAHDIFCGRRLDP
jgi:hypothetical protein